MYPCWFPHTGTVLIAAVKPNMYQDKKPHNNIQFVLDGALYEVDDVEPTRTLLDYLREDLQRTGTKEGCAEGDCGACTVVVGDVNADGENVSLHTANACLQCLPTLDGKQLFTVESLSSDPRNLHPVQKALVDEHASQCGFCTPGFVMSLFWLYKSRTQTNYDELLQVLSGNICRCTGYRPILDAGLVMHERYAGQSSPESWMATPGNATQQSPHIIELLNSATRSTSLELCEKQTGSLRYLAPRELDELADLYLNQPDATLLAGGTDIGIWITKAYREFSLLIYTGKVNALKQITVDDKNIEIGGAVTFTEAIPALLQDFPELEDFLNRFASLPIRNLATLGGNICNASPIGDSMPVLLSLGASLKLRRGKNCRVLPLHEFYLDYQKTALQSSEFLESICIPRRTKNSKFASYKISKRFDQDISAVCASFYLQEKHDGTHKITIAYGGVAAIPKRAYATEEFVNKNTLTSFIVNQALEVLDSEFTPLSDMRASANYRAQVSKNLLYRFLQTENTISVRAYQNES